MSPNRMPRSARHRPRGRVDPDRLLTVRERQVAELLTAGVSYRETARRLGISRKRVDQLCQQMLATPAGPVAWGVAEPSGAPRVLRLARALERDARRRSAVTDGGGVVPDAA